MQHRHYHIIKAETYYDLGLQQGRLLHKAMDFALDIERTKPDWRSKIKQAKAYIRPTQNAFPRYIEELKGYAQGAGAAFDELWTLSLENELKTRERCTTVITQDGRFIAHNEDWEIDTDKALCLMRKTVGHLTTFEVFYHNTLGGNSISINSHGCVQAINSLHDRHRRPGIPRNVIARWFSETKDPQKTFRDFQELKRVSGYSHNLIDGKGKTWSLESTALDYRFNEITTAFVHTNHYLTDLGKQNQTSNSSHKRYDYAIRHVSDRMGAPALKRLMSDQSQGKTCSLLNENTNARMVIDLKNHIAHVWLKREAELGWVKYDLDFMH